MIIHPKPPLVPRSPYSLHAAVPTAEAQQVTLCRWNAATLIDGGAVPAIKNDGELSALQLADERRLTELHMLGLRRILKKLPQIGAETAAKCARRSDKITLLT